MNPRDALGFVLASKNVTKSMSAKFQRVIALDIHNINLNEILKLFYSSYKKFRVYLKNYSMSFIFKILDH